MRKLLTALLAVTLSAPGLALAAEPQKTPAPVPTDAECGTLPKLLAPFPFAKGEVLEFDLDALGAQAGKMTMKTLPMKNGKLPVEVFAESNSFFSKVRRVKGTATSFLDPRTLKPSRYIEDAVENGVEKYADVRFSKSAKVADLSYRFGKRKGKLKLNYGAEGLDVAGAIYVIRQLPLKEGMKVCFDVYGIRRMWRVYGTVGKKEHVSVALGEFDAWHLEGAAVRLDNHKARREIHVWVSDDERRLPLAALGVIDVGAVRATLTGFSRPGEERARAEGKESLKW